MYEMRSSRTASTGLGSEIFGLFAPDVRGSKGTELA